MGLSELIHKSKPSLTVKYTDTIPDRKKTAIANSAESENPELQVIVWTPAGNPILIHAMDDEHMDFLIHMNPNPTLVPPIDDT